ncbi:MAG TPA: hypothetical protein VF183_16610 [Acidimicrobiales bacterium]
MRSEVTKRVGRGLLAWVVAAVVVRAVLLQPEQCGDPTVDALRRSADETVAWAVRTQQPDGRWIYRYDADADRDLGVYEWVRHAGLMMSLYQALTAGYEEAGHAADRGLDAIERSFVRHDGWVAVGGTTRNSPLATGATALLLAGLVERREATGEPVHDQLMAGLARFLSQQVEPSGAVAAYWDPVTEAPVPRTYSPFFTGEAFWALARMHTAFPDAGWDEPARRIARYLATERDDAEDRFPDIPDHWASYGFAEMTQWPGEEGGAALDDDMRAYTRHLAHLESMQIRWDSTRTNSWWSRLTRGAQAVGAGSGTIGEALTMLWRTPELRIDSVHERATCAVAVIVDRQIDATEATRYPNPDMVRGTWLTGGVTQIDDQQHSLSAVLNHLENLRARGAA